MDDVISIIMPAYNSSSTISAAIKSVLNQTYANYELIIINDGSIDNTVSICSEFLKDNRVKLFNIKNHGVSYARNYGLDRAGGKYIMFLDSDDQYEMDMLQIMAQNMKEQDADLVCCGYKLMDRIETSYVPELQTKSDDLFEIICNMKRNNLFNIIWNKIYRFDIIKQNKIRMDESISIGEDFLFNIKYLTYIQKISLLNDVLYKYNRTLGNLMSKVNEFDFLFRINQEIEYERLFHLRGFPTHHVYNEYIRIFYSSIIKMDNKVDRNTYIRKMLSNSKIKEALNIKCRCGLKYLLYKYLLRLGNCSLIYMITCKMKGVLN